MEETKEERIQRLVKEGIEKAKQEERIQKLVKEGIAAERDKNRNAKSPTSSPTSTASQVLMGLAFAFIAVAFIVFVLPSINLTNEKSNIDNSVSRSEIFATANTLVDDCSGSKGEVALTNCQKLVDYLKANREVLDSGKTKNWATDTIAIYENSISSYRNGDTSSSTTGGTAGTLEGSIMDDELMEYYNKCMQSGAKATTRSTITYARNLCANSVKESTMRKIITTLPVDRMVIDMRKMIAAYDQMLQDPRLVP